MRNLKFFLVIFVVLFTQSILAQKSERVWLTDKISIPAERNGCLWASSSVLKRERPSDLAGLIVYGFRGLFGKNIVYTAHYNCPPIINAINLSKTKVVTKFSNTSDTIENESQKIDVYIEHSDPENDVVTYNYEISGGKIIGRGSNVIWDLSNTQPGVYTITVCLDDGMGCNLEGAKNKQMKEVKVIECPDCKK